MAAFERPLRIADDVVRRKQPNAERRGAPMLDHSTTLPTWAAPDVVADDLVALAEHHKRLGISRRDARALRRVARIVERHDE